MNEEKNIKNEIDWKIIDQLHNATNNFSKTSLELKKLLFVVIGIAMPLLISLSNNKLGESLFFVLYIIVGIFWFFDCFTYYYQEKLREKMDKRFDDLSKRNQKPVATSTVVEEYTLQSNRKPKYRVFRSVFNITHIAFYGVLLILITIGLCVVS